MEKGFFKIFFSKTSAKQLNGPRVVSILSGTGVISNVTLIRDSPSGETVTFEGHFVILSLSGSFMLPEIGGQQSRTSGLSVSFARLDGQIFGGCVAGVLTAASTIQVIVGSYVADGEKEPKSANHFEASPAPLNANLRGSKRFGFAPRIIVVKTGEDVASKIMSFFLNGQRSICFLSAIGELSKVTLRKAVLSNGTVTYEGRFRIFSLSGSFVLSENSGQALGGLSVSVTGSDGQNFGGVVAGTLTAASSVQVLVGSFVEDGPEDPKSSDDSEASSSTLSNSSLSGMMGANIPPSRGTSGGSSG
ncbi:AT hook motif domain containing protein, expressed [Datura stramonium]|uniref:AT-hook motif nuclear-localized protein n=1 Tax=Datura stramonium TaxID=4076 RepID=A0ABS8SGU2_DATST|nr:AT hook motif domain containing protein, expressed [Datura stramonium]